MLQNSTFKKLTKGRGGKISKSGDFNRTVQTVGQHPPVNRPLSLEKAQQGRTHSHVKADLKFHLKTSVKVCLQKNLGQNRLI